MNPGRFEEQPMPETISTLWGAIFSSRIASLIDFNTPKSPQPGHQSGWTGPSSSLRVSSAVAIVISFRLPGVRPAGDQAAVDRPGVPADHQQAFRLVVGATHQLDLPDRLFVLRALRLGQAARTR